MRKLLFGSAAVTLGHVVRLGLQFLLLPVLAHLLSPEAYGAVALAMPIILLASMLGDVGLGVALVRVQRPARELESSAFWTSLLISAGLMAVILLAAPLIAKFLDHPGILALLWSLSPVLLLSSMNTVASARLQREGRLAVFAASDFASAVISMGVALLGAVSGWGQWSLVAQQLTLWTIKTGILLFASGAWPTLHLRIGEIRPFIGFGMLILVSNLILFGSRSIDLYVIGALLSVSEVGFYSMAAQIARLPEVVLTGPLFLSLFPTLSRVRDNPARLAEVARVAVRVMAMVTFPCMAGLAVVAPSLVAVLLPANWSSTGAIMIAMVPAGLIRCFLPISAAVVVALGRSGLQVWLAAIQAAASVLGIAAGAPFGAVGVAAANSLASLVACWIIFKVVLRGTELSMPSLLRCCVPAAVASLAMVTSVLLLQRHVLVGVTPLNTLVLSVVVGALVYGLTLTALGWRSLLSDLRNLRPQEALES